MAFAPSRLRRGEIIAGLSGIALLIVLFVIPWFRFAAHTDASGWESLPTLRWLIAAVALMGVLLAFFQASRNAPALPVAWSVIVTTLSAVMTVLVIIRLPTDGGRPRFGAYLGLVASAALTVGAFISLRQEDGWVPDRDHPIETIALGPPTHSEDS